MTIAVAFALGAADYLVRFSDRGLRIMATLALFATFIWAVYRWAYLPSRRRLAPFAVARRIEQRFPQLKDSLASAVEFLMQSEEDSTSGSAQLRRLVVVEAQNTVDDLNLDEVIDRRPLRRAASWLAAVTVLVAACAVWNAGAVTTALARLAAPLGSAEWPRKHYLTFRDVPTRLAAGQTFKVTLVDVAGPPPDDVRVEYRITGGGGTEYFSEPMVRAGDKMIARRENVRKSFAFRAVGGDDRAMQWYSVEVVEPPRLESLTIVVHPPAYSALPAVESDRHLEVMAGSAIEVRGMANEPLSAARILLDGMESIAADLLKDKTGKDARAFHVAPGKWIAAKSGPYRLELAGLDGLGSVAGSWNVRVHPDPPPTATWVRPTGDLYVTAKAVVPIEVIVKDNLAIWRVELVHERFNRSESEPAPVPMEPRIELYGGPDKAASPSTSAAGTQGDTQTVTHAWDLTPLDLLVGAQVSLHAEASDYRPGVGRTPTPRRISVISADELEARLADLQTQLVRQLERALSLQQSTREDVRGIQLQLDDRAAFESSDRNTLRTSELNQRRVTQSLADPAEGVPALVASLLEQVAINRLKGADVRSSMERLRQEIEQLSAGPLRVAERELLAANKWVDDAALPIEGKAISQFLLAASGAQDTVIATLERLIHELSGRADYRQLARELVELRKDQLAHADAAVAEIGVETLPLQISELTSTQRTVLNKAAAGQGAIARRYEKIERAMEGVTGQLSENDAEARAALEAVELARDLAIGAEMRETARDLSENRVGRALARESQIADKLQQVIDALRSQNKGATASLAQNLREAENQLAALREDAVALRQQLVDTEGQGNAASARQIAQLKTQQDSLQRDIDQLASQLDRLQASDAGQSARSAARRFDNRASSANRSPSQAPRPASSAAAEAAEQDLEQAAQQLANRRQQAEDDLALELVHRFQAELAEMVKRQQSVLNDTIEIERMRRPAGELYEATARSVAKLADEERTLARLAREHGELLYGLAAVRISLEDAERRLDEAANLLKNGDTGPSVQRAERHALARLEGMFEAFAQTASEAALNIPAEQPQSQAAQQTQQARRRPTFELLEVKTLRMLQADLNERTRQFKASVEGLSESASEDEQTELSREAQQLQAEQGRLSKLVDEMLNRDNEEAGR
ncbi:MAG TPA: hypothetical protein VGK58_21150 [Lacipirellulaceae bacterium]